jgi:hypothetical protein
MIAAAGSLQKLLHLANAREAFAWGDFPQALGEVDAAVAAAPAAPKTPPAVPLPKVTPASATDVEATEWASARLTRLNVRPRWRASSMHVDDAALIRDLGEGIRPGRGRRLHARQTGSVFIGIRRRIHAASTALASANSWRENSARVSVAS